VQQETKARELTQRVIQLPIFLSSQHIAAYWSANAEISPLEILGSAQELRKSSYLPCIHPQNPTQLCFAPYMLGEPLQSNRLGIQEPFFEMHSLINPQDLDLVLTPLLGFDTQGRRLGMGKGYYDRTFAFLNTEQRDPKPYLLGLAYALQGVEQLPPDPWDVLLNGVATDQAFIAF
jgi:5-formyltetrahydrofolate cyclo-ligase